MTTDKQNLAHRPLREPRSPAQSPRRPRAFTLVELMTVIVILSMLVGISMPSIMSVRRQMMRGTSQAVLTTISNAITAYANDFRTRLYPQGIPPASTASLWGTGYPGTMAARHILPMLLTGYANNTAGDGAPHGNLYTDDGVDNYGFCLVQRGKNYGPYNGSERLRTSKTRELHPTFLDSFDNSVFYYVYNNGYSDADNDDTNSAVTKPKTDLGGQGIDHYAQRDKINGQPAYGNSEYILCTPGPNGKWEAYLDDPSTDDVTNFLLE